MVLERGGDRGWDGWMDGVRRALQMRGMFVMEAKEHAMDRNAWDCKPVLKA